MYLEKFVMAIKPGSWTVWNFTHTLLSLPIWSNIPRLVGNAACRWGNYDPKHKLLRLFVEDYFLIWLRMRSSRVWSQWVSTDLHCPVVSHGLKGSIEMSCPPFRSLPCKRTSCPHSAVTAEIFTTLFNGQVQTERPSPPPHPSCFLSKLSSFLFHVWALLSMQAASSFHCW